MFEVQLLYRLLLALVGILCSLLLFFFANELAGWLGDVFPVAFQVQSQGTYYPGMTARNGLQWQLMWLGIAGGIATLFASTSPQSKAIAALARFFEKHARYFVIVLMLGVGSLYGYLAYPPNFLISNAALHWVDNFVHVAYISRYPLIGVIHNLFFDYPPLLIALLGGLQVFLAYCIWFQVIQRRATALLFAATLGFSTLSLLFANAAEGVLIVSCTVLATFWAYIARREYLFGCAAFLCVLARPQLGLLMVAFAGAEYYRISKNFFSLFSNTKALFCSRFFLTNIEIFLLLVMVYQALCIAFHVSMFTDVGDYNAASYLSGTSAASHSIAVDGFSIFPWSFAYFGHVLWIYPLPVTILCGSAVFFRKCISVEKSSLLLFLGIFWLLTISLHETAPLHYFNIRYITYIFPSALLAAWIVLTSIFPDEKHSRWRRATVTLIIFATLGGWHGAFENRETLKKSDLVMLYDDRFQLRELLKTTGTHVVNTSLSGKAIKNSLSYTFGVIRGDIQFVQDAIPGMTGLLVTDRPLDFRCQPKFRRGSLSVCIL